MPLSNKERQRLFRARKNGNPQARAEYLEEKRASYHKHKMKAKAKTPINQMTPSDARKKREQWREKKRIQRERKKMVDHLLNDTPQSMDLSIDPLVELQPDAPLDEPHLPRAEPHLPQAEPHLPQAEPFLPQAEPFLPKVQQHPSSCLTENVGAQSKLVGSLKKEKKRLKDEVMNLKRQLVRSKKKSEKLRKRLRRTNKLKGLSSHNRPRGDKKLAVLKKQRVASFLCRDENSRLLPGKKDTVTKNKEKVQRRVLLKTLKELHEQYQTETNKELSMSYRQFLRLRPFYVTEPKTSDRDTCACIDHENVQMLADKLAQHGMLKSASVSGLLADITCNLKRKDCMYRLCANCCYKEIDLDIPEGKADTTWQQWERVKNRSGDKEFTNYIKKTEDGTWQGLLKILNDKLDGLAKHHFNWIHQLEHCRQLKDTISASEVVFHMDYSENYACKIHTEIQAFHFGGSRNQATIHTSVVYSHTGIQSYVTISDSLRHDERAVWAHIEPVLKELKQRLPNVNVIHFMSDGPVTQYRNKTNFYLLSTLPFLMGFQKVTWNFSEKAHGKGAPDGLGGAVKRTADNKVKMGADIQTPKDLFDTVSATTSSTIKYFWIPEDGIQKYDEAVPGRLPVVKGTMKIHQLVCLAPGNIRHRELSCFCERGMKDCDCHNPSAIDLNSTEEEETSASTACMTTNLVGRFVIVKYDDMPFVGQVLNVVNPLRHNLAEVEVTCMRQTMGKNSFVWPTTPDVIFYYASNIHARLSEPEPSTSRSSKLCVQDWKTFHSMC